MWTLGGGRVTSCLLWGWDLGRCLSWRVQKSLSSAGPIPQLGWQDTGVQEKEVLSRVVLALWVQRGPLSLLCNCPVLAFALGTLPWARRQAADFQDRFYHIPD